MRWLEAPPPPANPPAVTPPPPHAVVRASAISGQQRFEELHQAALPRRDCPPPPCGRWRPCWLRAVGSASKLADELRQAVGASCTMRTAPHSTSMSRDVGRIEIVGARQDRQAERRRLEQVVAADGHQAAADERHVAGGIERRATRRACRPGTPRCSADRRRRWCGSRRSRPARAASPATSAKRGG